MRRFGVLLLLLLTVAPIGRAFAADYTLGYISGRDVYVMTYYRAFDTMPTGFNLSWSGAGGATASKDFTQADVTGVFYLTCNGQYTFTFYNGSAVLATFGPMTTTAVVGGACESYPSQQLVDDLNTVVHPPDASGLPSISWDDRGAGTVSIYKDGQPLDAVSGNVGNYHVPEPGLYSLVYRNTAGFVVGVSDVIVTDLQGGTDPWPGQGGEEPTCDVCDKLAALLECPGWSELMGELTQAIKDALPPPPDWDDIADKIGRATIDHLADYMGDVPPVPSAQTIEDQIAPPMPPLDTAVPEAEIGPAVPPEYNDGPIDFDITDGPEIPIIDGSEPFEIYEPDKYIKSDDPGTMVFPGDSRNSSDGIKQPATITTPYPTPVPTGSSSPVPPSTIPTPTVPPSTMPLPTVQGGPGPVPGQQ